MKFRKLKKSISVLMIAAVMLAAPASVGLAGGEAMGPGEAGETAFCMLCPDFAYAAVSSSKAKQIATKDAKSRYKFSKAYSVKASSGTYKSNKIYKVTFSGKKSSTTYRYTYYVSKSSGKILYRKQSI